MLFLPTGPSNAWPEAGTGSGVRAAPRLPRVQTSPVPPVVRRAGASSAEMLPSHLLPSKAQSESQQLPEFCQVNNHGER